MNSEYMRLIESESRVDDYKQNINQQEDKIK